MVKGLVTLFSDLAIAAPGANTDILSTALTPKEGSALKITVLLATGSVFNMTVTDGTNTYTGGLNASAALNAGDRYTFTVGADPANSYNFQVETDGIIQCLIIQEAQFGTS